jgi:hypothetical protein
MENLTKTPKVSLSISRPNRMAGGGLMDPTIASVFFSELNERALELRDSCESGEPDRESFSKACAEILDEAGMLSDVPEFVLIDKPGHRLDAICYPEPENHRVCLLGFIEYGNWNGNDKKDIEQEAVGFLNKLSPLIRAICSGTRPAGICPEMEVQQQRIRAITPMPEAIVIYIVTNALAHTRKDIEKKLNKTLDRLVTDDTVIQVKFTDLYTMYSYKSGAVHGATEEFPISGRDVVQCIKVHSSLNHDVYLAAFSGREIARIVKKHGQLLYQKNVRAFLGLRGKTNKKIIESVRQLPDHFLALNNGVTMTVSGIQCVTGEGTTYLKSAEDIQIVNGGQTTKTLEHEYREGDADCLAGIRVFTKIIHVKIVEAQNDWIDRIAETSNTQNVIKVTDLGAANPIIKKIKELADKTPFWRASESHYWFFSRLKNEYNIELAHRKGTAKAEFLRKYPKEFVIKNKSELLLADRVFCDKPWRAAQGESKCHADFIESMAEDFIPDENWYRNAIGRVILVRAAGDIAKQLGVKEGRSSVVQYACGLLARDGIEYAILASRNQQIDDKTKKSMTTLISYVRDFFASLPDDKSLKEYAKLEKTWTSIKEKRVRAIA